MQIRAALPLITVFLFLLLVPLNAEGTQEQGASAILVPPPNGLISPDWRLEVFLPANQLSVASDVTVSSKGKVYVAEAWDTISSVSPGGSEWTAAGVMDDPLTPGNEKLRVYSIDSATPGVLWGYNFAEGKLFMILESEQKPFPYQSFTFPEVQGPFEGTITACPDGSVLIGANVSGKSSGRLSRIYRLEGGSDSLKLLREFHEDLRAIAVHPDHKTLYVALKSGIHKMSVNGKTLHPFLTPAPEQVSYSGMAFSPNGELYISTGAWSDSGGVYRISTKNRSGKPKAKRIYRTSQGGFQGISIGGDGNGGFVLYGVSRRTGDLYRIPLEEIDRRKDYRIIHGNGTSIHQMLAWGTHRSSGKPELYISDGETGRILRMDAKTKKIRKLTDIVNYSFFGSKMNVSKATGDLYFAVCAPGFMREHGIVRITPLENAARQKILQVKPANTLLPASVVSLWNGSLLFTNLQAAGQIVKLTTDGELKVLVDHSQVPLLHYPTGLVRYKDGSLLVSVNRRDTSSFEEIPASDTILRLTRSDEEKWNSQVVFEGILAGETSDLQYEPINDFDIDPEGNLYISYSTKILQVKPPYKKENVSILAGGFDYLLGMAIDENGKIYFSDGESGAIFLLTPVDTTKAVQ